MIKETLMELIEEYGKIQVIKELMTSTSQKYKTRAENEERRILAEIEALIDKMRGNGGSAM